MNIKFDADGYYCNSKTYEVLSKYAKDGNFIARGILRDGVIFGPDNESIDPNTILLVEDLAAIDSITLTSIRELSDDE